MSNSASNDIAARIAAAKAKISSLGGAPAPAASVSQSHRLDGECTQASDVWFLSQIRPPLPAKEEKQPGIHPLLMQRQNKTDQQAGSKKAQMKPMAPIFSTVRANASAVATSKRPSLMSEAPAPIEANPYLVAAQEASAEASGSGAPKQRSTHRGLHFSRPGRHIREAEELRREEQLEQIKRRIAESAKKAGLEGTGEERVLKKQRPPAVEWWDEQFMPKGVDGYDGIIIPGTSRESAGKGKERAMEEDSDLPAALIEGEDTPIDHLIQHPIPIPAPGDQDKIPLRGVMLTKKEMKKMRRLRRQADIQDKRDRIKMGLLPPPPPKVKLSNLMRVLTNEAVADPTKIEAKIRREVAARREQHERTNLERKLTPDQRRAKLEQEKENDEIKGLSCLAFKIKHLVSPSHKFKIRKNAKDLGLTGITVFGPNFALVIVEGGPKAIKSYRRLMTVRINWIDPGRPKDASDDEGEAGPSAPPAGGTGADDTTQQDIENVDWGTNTCELIFEGPIRERTWPNGFRGRGVEGDHEA